MITPEKPERQSHSQVDCGLCLQIMGFTAAVVQVVPLSLLYMRRVLRGLLSLGLCLQGPHQSKVVVSLRFHKGESSRTSGLSSTVLHRRIRSSLRHCPQRTNSSGSYLAPHAIVLSDSAPLGRNAMGTPASEGPVVSGERDLPFSVGL